MESVPRLCHRYSLTLRDRDKQIKTQQLTSDLSPPTRVAVLRNHFTVRTVAPRARGRGRVNQINFNHPQAIGLNAKGTIQSHFHFRFPYGTRILACLLACLARGETVINQNHQEASIRPTGGLTESVSKVCFYEYDFVVVVVLVV